MSDSPAPISYINDENETSNNPSIDEEKQNISNYNDYPENIEPTNDNNNTNPKPNSSVRITYSLNLIILQYFLYLHFQELEVEFLICSSEMVILELVLV